MSRKLTSRSSLENLKREGKRWLKALRDGATDEPSSEAPPELLTAAQSGDTARLGELLDAHPELIDARGHLRGHTGLRTGLHFGNHHYDVERRGLTDVARFLRETRLSEE